MMKDYRTIAWLAAYVQRILPAPERKEMMELFDSRDGRNGPRSPLPPAERGILPNYDSDATPLDEKLDEIITDITRKLSGNEDQQAVELIEAIENVISNAGVHSSSGPIGMAQIAYCIRFFREILDAKMPVRNPDGLAPPCCYKCGDLFKAGQMVTYTTTYGQPPSLQCAHCAPPVWIVSDVSATKPFKNRVAKLIKEVREQSQHVNEPSPAARRESDDGSIIASSFTINPNTTPTISTDAWTTINMSDIERRIFAFANIDAPESEPEDPTPF
jgi:hypothetical protein